MLRTSLLPVIAAALVASAVGSPAASPRQLRPGLAVLPFEFVPDDSASLHLADTTTGRMRAVFGLDTALVLVHRHDHDGIMAEAIAQARGEAREGYLQVVMHPSIAPRS